MPTTSTLTRTVLALAAAALVWGASPPPTARAATPAEQAEALVRQGLKDARAKRFDAAVKKFEAAVRLDPKPVYVHNLARTYQVQGKLAQAYRRFEEALTINPDYTFAKDARKYMKVIGKKLRATHARVRVQSTPSEVVVTVVDAQGGQEDLLKTPFERWVPAGTLELKGRKSGYQDGDEKVEVAAGEERTVKVTLLPVPKDGYLSVLADAPNAVVYINGEKIGPSPVESRVVKTGTYMVEVRADGYPAWMKTVVVLADQNSQVVAHMADARLAPGKGSGAQSAASGGGLQSTLGYVFLGAGGAALGAGIALNVMAIDKQSQSDDLFFTQGVCDPIEGDPLKCDESTKLLDDAKSLQTGDIISYVLAGALVTSGVLLLVLDDDAPAAPSPQEAAGVSLLPVFAVVPRGGVAGAALRF